MPIITELNIDLSGISPDNLIQDELKETIDNFSKVLIPTYGNYFTESLQIKNSSSILLIRDIDYACIEFDQNNSLRSGKEICSAILILNSDTAPFTITYQALGGDTSFNRQQLLAAYNSLDQSNGALNWEDIESLPTAFKTKDHLHDIEDIYGFEFIVKTLIRIKKAIEVTQVPKYKSLLAYIDNILQTYQIRSDEYLENKMPDFLQSFLQGLNKIYFDIDKLSNLETATELDGENTAKRLFTSSDLIKDKYAIVETLIGLKKTFYKRFIEKKYVGIGFTQANYISPQKFSLQQLPNGAIGSLISQSKSREEGINIDQEVYVDEILDNSEQTIVKITNNTINNTGVFIGLDQTDKSFHLGALAGLNPTDLITWKRLQNADQSSGLLDVLAKHIVDYGNPHEVDETDIGLELVENLPVVEKEDMMALKSVHKYLTFDALIFFMRAFLLQNGKKHATTESSKNQFIIDNCVVVFTPAGIACKETCDVAPAPPRGITFSKINQSCSLEGETFTIENGYYSDTVTDISLMGEYNIGTGTNLIQPIKHFSQCCGYDEDPMDFLFNASSSTRWLTESSVDNMLPGSYFTVRLTYPGSNAGTLRVSGVFPDENYFTFRTGSNLGNIQVEYKNRYYVTKTATLSHTVDQESPDPDTVLSVFLYMDRKYIKQGTTANAEVYIQRPDNDTNISYNLKWRKNSDWSLLNIAELPTSMNVNVSSSIVKLDFTIPYLPELNDDGLVCCVDYTGGEAISNKLSFVSQASTFTTKTLPLYIDNVTNGTITIKRENETGYVTIENINIPSAQNTSDVYFLRNSSTSNEAPITAVVDVWNDGSQTDWEFPLLTN